MVVRSGPETTDQQLPASADYIVVGGGWAGCAVAARLSENPAARVLLLEAGRENDYESSYYAAGAHAMWKGPTNWHLSSTPQDELGGQTLEHHRGRLIGGSAAINVGSWSRGIPADYDEWELLGADGWNWQTALSWFRKIERSSRADDGTRGHNGPLALEDTPTGNDMAAVFEQACLAVGIGTTSDHNGSRFEGLDRWETIFPEGRRTNTAEAYLKIARCRANLRVITDALVTRIAIEDHRVVGVEYEIGGMFRRVSALGEVILCAGAFQSPQLLLLSGIGAGRELNALGIPVVVDLAGVGENLIDHLNVAIGGSSVSGGIAPVLPDPMDPVQLETWRRTGYGPLAVSAAMNPAIAFVRSRPELKFPDIELLFGINPPEALSKGPTTGGFTIVVANVKPKSRGNVRLRSPDPHDSPLIDFRYLSDASDLGAMIGGVRRAMAVAATEPLSRYTAHLDYDPLASDDALAELVRSRPGTMYHPVGTAAMGGRDSVLAVLDDKLRVRGVSGLRVADAASMPGTVRGHTMAPTLYVAERCCEFIREQDGRDRPF